MKSRIHFLLIIVSILSVFSTIFVSYDNVDKKSEITVNFKFNQVSTLENYTPIIIIGNAELLTFVENEQLRGNGTFDSPYVIENYFINASTSNGIDIQSTDAYLTILNCTIIDSGIEHNTGIYLSNSSNINISTNDLSGNFNGICLENSFNNTISRNVVNNSWDGIYLIQSYNNTLIRNVAINSWNGIYLEYSFNNTVVQNNLTMDIYGIHSMGSSNNSIVQNDANYNSFYGIYLYNLCENNTISLNTVNNNSYAGIYLEESCTSNTLVNNYANNNSKGISLYKSSENTIYNNTANFNTGNGINLDTSPSNTLNNNFLVGNRDGIYLDHSSSNKLRENLVTNNSRDGISLEASNANSLINNSIYFNKENGILQYGSPRTTNHQNTISNNDCGIYLDVSDRSNLTNNNIINNKNGIILSSSNLVSMRENYISNRNYGLFIFSSSNNTVIGNNVNYNKEGIILFANSDYNKIYFNSIHENTNSQANEDGDCIGNSWDNGTTGNYWGEDYIINYPSAVNDGYIWSIPYEIKGSGAGIDNYPLVNGSAIEVDNIQPIFSHIPDDFSEYEGYINLNLTWIISDLYPDTYTIELNGNTVVTDTEWVSGIVITFNIPNGLQIGEYNITIVVCDTSHNIAQDSVKFIVIEQTTTSTVSLTKNTSTTEPQTSSWPTFGIVILAIATALIKRNRRD